MAAEESAAQDYDVDAIIAAFVNDESATSLELPRALSAEQRKQAKRLVDQHKSLKCESFGFGADRRLHLFKQSGQLGTVSEDREPWSPVCVVKNTFIDDFVENKAEGSGEALAFRSLPNRFGSQRIWDQEGVEEARQQPPAAPPPAAPPIVATSVAAAVAAASSDASSGGSTEVRSESALSRSGTGLSSSGAGGAELPELPETIKFTVRDTFIHVEEAETRTAAARAIQSMPEDGVFQRQLQAERAAAAAAAAAALAARGPPATPPPLSPGGSASGGPTSPPPAAAPPSPPPAAAPAVTTSNFLPGTEVTIEGLVKIPAFNGRSGTIDSFDAAQGRYNVLLDSPATAGGSRWAKVRGENLRLRLPPPPHHAPTLSTKPPALTEVFSYAPPSQSIPPTPQWEESYDGRL